MQAPFWEWYFKFAMYTFVNKGSFHDSVTENILIVIRIDFQEEI